MKMTRFSMAGKATLGVVAIALLTAAGSALANTTNSVPSSFSFEGYSDGQAIVGTNGWYGEEGVMTAVATNQPYAGQFPIQAADHEVIAKLTGSVTNLFVGNSAMTNVWMDLLIQPRRWQQEDPPSDIPEDAQAVIYVDTNGYLNAMCKYYPEGEFVPTNVWANFTQVQFETNDWMRLTLAFKYQATFFGEAFYQIQVNNSETLTNQYGQTSPGANDSGGSWFLCAKFDATEFNSVTFSGNSQIDDLVISNLKPDITPLRYIKVIAGTGSIFAPAGPNVPVQDGTNKTFTITTDTGMGYELTNLWWGDGLGEEFATNAITITNSLSMSYSFMNVTSDYTIKAEAYQPQWQGSTAQNGTPIQWLQDNNLTAYPSANEAEAGNDDTDTALNWEEYVAGTDPNDGLSYFHIVAQGHGSPSNYVSFFVTTNSGVIDPVDIYRSIDLMNPAGWSIVGNDIVRDASGTSTWWDVTAPSNTPAFYKPVIDWNP